MLVPPRVSAPSIPARWFVYGAFLLALPLAGCQKKAPESSQTISLVQNSIALLENGAETDKEGKLLNESLDGFRKISQQFPKDPLGHQNLAVTLLIRLKLLDETDSKEEFQKLSAELESVLTKLAALEPDEPDAPTLLGRYHLVRNNPAEAIAAFRNAISRKNARPETYYQLIQQLQTEGGGNPIPELEGLYASALQLAPTNIVLQVGYLDALIKNQSSQAALS